MNYFEHELKKLLAKDCNIRNAKYIGRACYGRLGTDLRAKIELVAHGVADQYEGIRVTIINKKESMVDSNTLLFRDLLGKKKVSNPNFSDGVYPHLWMSGEKLAWYVYEPSAEDCKKISEMVNDYLDLFGEQEMEHVQAELSGQQQY